MCPLHRWFPNHPVLSTAVPAVAAFAIFYLWFYWPRRRKTFDYDPGEKMGAFEEHAKRYQSLATLLLTLSSASVAFFVNFLVNIAPDSSNRNFHSLRLESAAPSTITLLCLSATCALAFLLCQSLFYEDYVHSKYTVDPRHSRETYTGARYALTLTLATAGLVFFLLAFVVLALSLFR